jgi:hypothetical protein
MPEALYGGPGLRKRGAVLQDPRSVQRRRFLLQRRRSGVPRDRSQRLSGTVMREEESGAAGQLVAG